MMKIIDDTRFLPKNQSEIDSLMLWQNYYNAPEDEHEKFKKYCLCVTFLHFRKHRVPFSIRLYQQYKWKGTIREREERRRQKRLLKKENYKLKYGHRHIK